MVQYTQSSPGHLNLLPFACFPGSRHCVICANVQTETARTQKQSPQTWHACKHFKQLIKLWTFCYKVADTVKHICQGKVFFRSFPIVLPLRNKYQDQKQRHMPFISCPSACHICIPGSIVSKSFKYTFLQNASFLKLLFYNFPPSKPSFLSPSFFNTLPLAVSPIKDTSLWKRLNIILWTLYSLIPHSALHFHKATPVLFDLCHRCQCWRALGNLYKCKKNTLITPLRENVCVKWTEIHILSHLWSQRRCCFRSGNIGHICPYLRDWSKCRPVSELFSPAEPHSIYHFNVIQIMCQGCWGWKESSIVNCKQKFVYPFH